MRFGRIEWTRASGLPRHPAYCRRAIASSPTTTAEYAGAGVQNIYRKQKSTLACALVGLSGLEPPTPTLSGWCSNLLSYNPISTINLAEPYPTIVSVSHLPCVARWCSNLLSYNPISTINLAEPYPAIVSVSHLPCVARWCSKPCELQSYIHRTNLARTIYPYISTGCVRSPRIFCIFHGLRKSAKPLLPTGIRHWWR